MTRRTMLVGVAMVCAAVSIPTSSVGSHGAGCGGNWTGSRSCPFDFRGFPIIVSGHAEAISGARVHVWVTEARQPDHILLECESSGGTFARCEDDLGIGEQVDLLLPLWTFKCHVEGKSLGRYWCQSGRGF